MRASELDSGDPELALYRVDNGTVALTFLPSVGGRLLSVRYEDRELLWVNPAYFDDTLAAVRPRAQWPRVDGTFASWANIGGSKSWPAPQGWGGTGEWAGPPDDVLDSGMWSFDVVESEDGVVVTMRSAADHRTGLRIEREFSVPVAGATFEEKIRFENASGSPVTWALWEVCQVATEPGGVVEVESPVDSSVDLGSYVSTLHAQWGDGQFTVPVQDAVAKIGFPAAEGTVSYRGPSGGLQLHFTAEVGEYPDSGSRAEVWMQFPVQEPIAQLSGLHPGARLAELEVLSPLTEIAPGGIAELRIGWLALPVNRAS